MPKQTTDWSLQTEQHKDKKEGKTMKEKVRLNYFTYRLLWKKGKKRQRELKDESKMNETEEEDDETDTPDPIHSWSETGT